MPILNTDIARIFNQMADILDIRGANPFRVRAYRNAARTIGNLSHSVAEMEANGDDLTSLAGIGADLAGKIHEIITTGTFSQLKELQQEIPPEVTALLDVPDLGPKRVATLYQDLGIRSLADLEDALEKGTIRQLDGFGEKLETKIRHSLQRRQADESVGRTLLARAEELTRSLVDDLGQSSEVDRIAAAGSYRRRRETVGDLDILVTGRDSRAIMDRFVAGEDVGEVIARGDTKTSVLLRNGLQVDLRLVPEECYGAALVYFTGSKAHNVAIRRIGAGQNLKINEYGVFRGDDRVAGETEAAVYQAIGLDLIPPELRENRGEIEAARRHRLPDLIRVENIRGDLQSHTDATDGKATLEEMARAARDRGYEYLAITDHSRRVTMAHGLDEKRLRRQMAAIDDLNGTFSDFRILKSIEVDILKDGSLDLPDEVLGELDLVVAAVHYHLDLPADRQTERILRALDHPYVDILAHPTGRLIGSREPAALDLERIISAAAERGCFLECNAQPERLDLNDLHCRMAREAGVKVVISTDAHTPSHLALMRFGIDQARRGWLSADDVLNTRSWNEILKLRRPR